MKRLRPDNPNADTTLAWRAFQAGGCQLPQTDWARLTALAQHFKGGKYVDVGCGASPMLEKIAVDFPEAVVIGLDHDEHLVGYLQCLFNAKFHFRRIDYRHVSPKRVNCLPFVASTVDYIVAGELIEHLDDPAAFIAETYRVLKPGGMIALSTPLSEGVRHGRVSDQHVWSFEGPDVEGLLQSAGFIDVRAELFKEDSFPIILGYGRKA